MSEIPAATQLFTPRWIVRALVENSLGRLWLQMHPDSRLRDHLHYLIPEVDAPTAAMKPVREITLLDPACGTMHFGLVAFDLFVEMYQEEIEHAGEPGWPEQPSVRDASEIAAAIVEHNLFGIDIDLRAVQLSALTLYLKAAALNPKVTQLQSNLACADVLLLNGHRLDAFLTEMRFERPIYERVIRAVWKRLRDANQLGSLLRLEDEIRGLVVRNVATLVDAPRIRRPDIAAMTPEQARSLLAAVHGDRLEALYTVALAVGLRLGEALGVQWSAIDLENGTLTVRTALQRVNGALQLVEPKSASSRRTVVLPQVAVEALQAHRTRQLEERLLAGGRREECGLVFTTTEGKPLDARNVFRSFQRLLARAGLPHLRLHDLRHGCATLLIAQGVHPRTIMEILGHSQISLTMNTYGHVTHALQRDAAARVDAVFANDLG